MTITKRLVKGSGLTHAEGDENLRDLSERMGWVDYNDAATAGSPIALTLADTFYPLTNDGLGAFTNKDHKIAAHGEIWDAGAGEFDFSSLKVGDTVEVRADISVTTTGPTRDIITEFEVAIGAAGTFKLQIDRRSFKVAGTYQIVMVATGYIGNADTRDFPSKINVSSDGLGTTVVVNGWFVKTHVR